MQRAKVSAFNRWSIDIQHEAFVVMLLRLGSRFTAQSVGHG